ncbi:MAG TPA: flagellar basal body rod protein FlgC [Burkholderiales bacterium]|nr:flagellar basal body rod protein FlgC [Pseudomonadota bacterium]HVC49323.1 flagellar basal body rod protein FlgC [Burkholderiales bacterium]
MSLFSVFNIANSALSAESVRLNVVASNLANIDSINPVNHQPYQAKEVVFKVNTTAGSEDGGVKVAGIVEDQSPPQMVYEPNNPYANSKGFVAKPNINPINQMIDMISASRAYDTNVNVMNTAKQLLVKTLTLGQ